MTLTQSARCQRQPEFYIAGVTRKRTKRQCPGRAPLILMPQHGKQMARTPQMIRAASHYSFVNISRLPDRSASEIFIRTREQGLFIGLRSGGKNHP